MCESYEPSTEKNFTDACNFANISKEFTDFLKPIQESWVKNLSFACLSFQEAFAFFPLGTYISIVSSIQNKLYNPIKVQNLSYSNVRNS